MSFLQKFKKWTRGKRVQKELFLEVSSEEKIAIRLVATFCEQANSRGDYGKLSEIRDAILRSSFSNRKELIAARIVIDEILHAQSEQKSKAALLQSEKDREAEEAKRLLAEKEKALLQSEKDREAEEAKRLLAEKEKALLQSEKDREAEEAKRLIAEKEKVLLQLKKDFETPLANDFLESRESEEVLEPPQSIDPLLYSNQTSIQSSDNKEDTLLCERKEELNEDLNIGEYPPIDKTEISINYKDWNKENRINLIAQINNDIEKHPGAFDLGINQVLQIVSGNTEGLLYKLRQNGLNSLRDLSLSDDDTKTLFKLFRGVTRSEIKKIQQAIKILVQQYPPVSVDERSESIRNSKEFTRLSERENVDEICLKEKPKASRTRLAFQRKVKYVILSEDSENIYRVRFDLAGKTIVINEDHEFGPELYRLITADEYHSDIQIIIRAILEEASNEEFIKSFSKDGKTHSLVRELITRILSQIL